ncbi:MAG: hypothetical protein QXZ31_09880 [Thermofilaceae archaeon]
MFAASEAVGAATSTFRALSLLAAAIAVSIAQPVASSSSHQSTAPDYAREKVPVTRFLLTLRSLLSRQLSKRDSPS